MYLYVYIKNTVFINSTLDASLEKIDNYIYKWYIKVNIYLIVERLLIICIITKFLWKIIKISKKKSLNYQRINTKAIRTRISRNIKIVYIYIKKYKDCIHIYQDI